MEMNNFNFYFRKFISRIESFLKANCKSLYGYAFCEHQSQLLTININLAKGEKKYLLICELDLLNPLISYSSSSLYIYNNSNRALFDFKFSFDIQSGDFNSCSIDYIDIVQFNLFMESGFSLVEIVDNMELELKRFVKNIQTNSMQEATNGLS